MLPRLLSSPGVNFIKLFFLRQICSKGFTHRILSSALPPRLCRLVASRFSIGFASWLGP
jgi:hypothetical protein